MIFVIKKYLLPWITFTVAMLYMIMLILTADGSIRFALRTFYDSAIHKSVTYYWHENYFKTD